MPESGAERIGTLDEFTEGEDNEESEYRDTCTAGGCSELVGPMATLCFGCQSHKNDPDGELVERETGYDPEQPECGYCGRVARPSHDPRRCRQCGTLDDSEVIR